MKKKIRIFNLILSVLLFTGRVAWGQDAETTTDSSDQQGEPVFTLADNVHDFGLVDETGGLATCVFRVQNTGSAPLIIKHVQSSCGCTEPEWTKHAIEPGKQGDIVISFDPTNRPGPFRKNVAVYTNEKVFRRQLVIKGEVAPKSRSMAVLFQDTIGTVQVEQHAFSFNAVRPKDQISTEIWIRSFAEENLALTFENVPDYLRIEAPEQLKIGKAERFKVTVDGSKVEKKGRRTGQFVWKTTGRTSGKVFTQPVSVSVNFVDDFAALTAEEEANSAAIQLSTTLLEYGVLKPKGGFLGLGNKRASRQVTLTNTGKSALTIHSLSSDDVRVQISGFNGQSLRPGESLRLTVSLNPKNITDDLETTLYILCNDPQGPVRQIKITAQKQL
jgi:hypothetical protein